MNQDEKWVMAEKLVDLIVKDTFPPPITTNAPAQMKAMHKAAQDKNNKLQVELHAKHYSDDQLRTLLKFYESEMGTSILHAQAEITAEFTNQIPELIAEMNSRSEGEGSGEIGVFEMVEVKDMTNGIEALDTVPIPPDENVYDYIFKVYADEDSSDEVAVKVAISTNESLELFTKETPIEYRFSSNRYYIFYESLNKSTKVRAEIYSNQFRKDGLNSEKPSSGHSGSAGRGKFIRDPRSQIDMCGGDGS